MDGLNIFLEALIINWTDSSSKISYQKAEEFNYFRTNYETKYSTGQNE